MGIQPLFIRDLPLCLACGGNTLKPVLNLGKQALANLLLPSPTEAYLTYPLMLNRCTQCGHGQLAHSIHPSLLYTNYAYASGTSKTLLEYFDWFADECADLMPPGASALEIGCNDGSLLTRLNDRSLSTFGVDPAANLANDKVRVKVAMWPQSTISGRKLNTIVGPHKEYDLIIALNVIAHGPDPLTFLIAARRILSAHGVLLVQVSQSHMLERGELDTIYHEHNSFFTISSMTWLAARAELYVRMVKEVSVHGGSLVFVISQKHRFELDVSEFMKEGPFLVHDELPKLGSQRDYKEFTQSAKNRIIETQAILTQYHQQGYHIAFIGAAAKAVVFLNTLMRKPDSVHDESPLKIDKWIPGTKLQIKNLESLTAVDKPVLAVISAWNFKQELVDKVKALQRAQPTKFLTYFPSVEEFD